MLHFIRLIKWGLLIASGHKKSPADHDFTRRKLIEYAEERFSITWYPCPIGKLYSERVEIWKGDVFAGSVGIDPSSGLLKINQGGDFGPMEWYGDRTEFVFNSISMDSIKESIGRYCLDEGIGIFDKNRTSNVQTANNDVSASKDARLLSALEQPSSKQSSAMKR